MKTKVTDMTTGSPFKVIFVFALPIALGFMLQQFYALGDSLIVALSRGANATTGINITGSTSFLILGFCAGFTTGFGIVLSQFVGAKDEEKMRKSFATSFTLCLIISTVLAVISYFLTGSILKLLNTHEDYFAYAKNYLQAIFIGIPFTMLYNHSTQVMRAMGDSKTPLLILIICAVLNIGLNSLLFITDFGVEWAGYATVISQGISAVICYAFIYAKFPSLRVKKEDLKLEWKFSVLHLANGFPMSLQFVITASGCMILQKAFNTLPDPKYAMAQGTASKIDNIFGVLLNGAGTAMATFTGQNYGAKKYDRLMEGYKQSFLVGAVYTVISSSLAIALAIPFGKLLLPDVDNEVYECIFNYLLIQGLLYYFLFMIFNARSALQGIGKSGLTVYGGVIELLMRIVGAYVLCEYFGFIGGCFTNPLAWAGGGIYFVIVFGYELKKLIRAQKQETAMQQETVSQE